jgi:uncharacterized phage protein gp47/JayE
MAQPTIPSIQEISDRIYTDITGKINQGIPTLPLSFVKVLSAALAALFFLKYLAIIWVYRQIFPATADYENLVLHGAVVDTTPVSAVQAVLLCDIDGSGAQVSAGTLFTGTNNIVYRVVSTVPIVGGTAPDVQLLALTSGDIGNLENGEILNIASVDLGLDGTALVVDTLTSGADAESDESFSERVALRYRTRYINGSTSGYAQNGLECPNFIWVGPYAHPTLPGAINIFGKVDNQVGGIPTQGQLNELLDYVTYDPITGKTVRRPTCDTVYTLPIFNRQFDLEVFISGSNSEINANITTAVNNYMDSLEPYIEGMSGSRKDVLTNTGVASEADAVAVAAGAKVTSVTITDVLTALPETNYTFYGGEFGVFRNITFTVVI